jgi:16S rRNA C1402 (ribose-2'-O) methylase RsmI
MSPTHPSELSFPRHAGAGGVLRFRARGHRNIKATHRKTLEITREAGLTERGSCIVGVAADFEPRRVALLRGPVVMRLRVVGLDGAEEEAVEEEVRAIVTPHMAARETLVIRRSGQRAGRTFAFSADKGARDLDRKLIRALRDPAAVLEVEIEPLPPGELPVEEDKDGAYRPALVGALYVVSRAQAEHPSAELRQLLTAVDAAVTVDPLPDWMMQLDPPMEQWPLTSAVAPDEAVTAAADALSAGARLALLLDEGTLAAESPELALVRAAWERRVTVTPGPTTPTWWAVTAAAGAAHPPVQWLGELPRRRRDLTAALAQGRGGGPLVLTAPTRHLFLLGAYATQLLPGFQATVVEDPGGRKELWWRGPVHRLGQYGSSRPKTSDPCWLVLEPASGEGAADAEDPEDAPATVDDLLTALLDHGLRVRTLSPPLAAAQGWGHRKAYQHLLELGRRLDQRYDDEDS